MSIFGMISTRTSLPYTALGLRSFAQHTAVRPGDRFILIDNDCSLTDELAIAENFPIPIRLDLNPEPRGFATNFNRLIDESLDQQEDLYLLNNDLVFTPNWRAALEVDNTSILSPLSNREVQYASSVIVPKTSHILNLLVLEQAMKIDDIAGNEAAFSAIAEAHSKSVHGYHQVFVLPFFCTRLPLTVMQRVGRLDESYGKGGGEDFDYCLRAHLLGCRVTFALSSFVLHFGGKSSWSGAETSNEQQQRETSFQRVFREKWGDSLFELILRENASVLGENLNQVVEEADIVKNIQLLMANKAVELKI